MLYNAKFLFESAVAAKAFRAAVKTEGVESFAVVRGGGHDGPVVVVRFDGAHESDTIELAAQRGGVLVRDSIRISTGCYIVQEVAWRDDRGEWKRRTIKTPEAFARFSAKMEAEAREWHARNAER